MSMNERSKAILKMMVIILLSVFFYMISSASNVVLKTMGAIGFFELFYSILCWKRITGYSLTPYTLFLTAAYVFTFGQSILYVFDWVDPRWDLMNKYANEDLFQAQMYTLVYLGFFHIGALLSCKRKKVVSPLFDKDLYYTSQQISGIRTIGIFFIIISIIPFFLHTLRLFVIWRTLGYGGIYDQEAKIGFSNINNILAGYFIPGILCMLLVEKESKMKRLFWIIILLSDIIFNMMIGARTNGVILAAVILVYYHFCIKKIKAKQAVVIIVVGYLFVSTLSIIGSIRSDTSASYKQAFAENIGKTNAVSSSISEMGGSMFPMLHTLRLVPSIYDYKYGSSYLFSLTSIIPNMGFWDLHPAMKYGNLNAWLQEALQLGYGPGFSIVAEAYINFGSLGFLMMLLLGWVFGKVFYFGEYNKNNPLPFVLSVIFCYLVTSTVRNSFLATVRSIFYYILPIYLMVVYVKKGKYIIIE